MGKNRNKLGIIASILEAAVSGAHKTRIMFAANLSFKLLEKYLATVVNAGFVQVDGSSYVLTGRGQEFLQKYRIFNEKYSKAQERIDDLVRERDCLLKMCETTPIVESRA